MVVEAGRGAVRFRLGDAVFGMQTVWGRMGCYAEYVAISESALARQTVTSRFARLLHGGHGRSAHAALVRADGAALQRSADLMADGKVRSVIDSIYVLADAARAHERSRSFRSRGKPVLQVR